MGALLLGNPCDRSHDPGPVEGFHQDMIHAVADNGVNFFGIVFRSEEDDRRLAGYPRLSGANLFEQGETVNRLHMPV